MRSLNKNITEGRRVSPREEKEIEATSPVVHQEGAYACGKVSWKQSRDNRSDARGKQQ